RTTGGMRPNDRDPQLSFARAFVVYPSPWASFADRLVDVTPDDRARFVDAVARAIALSHLSIQFIKLDFDGSAEKLFSNLSRLMNSQEWSYRFESLIDQLAAATHRDRDADNGGGEVINERMQRLLEGLRSANRVQYIDGSSDESTWQSAVHGFNTPM